MPVVWARPDATPTETSTDAVEVTVDVVEVLRTVELELWDVDVGVEECVDVVWVELWVVGFGVEDVVE